MPTPPAKRVESPLVSTRRSAARPAASRRYAPSADARAPAIRAPTCSERPMCQAAAADRAPNDVSSAPSSVRPSGSVRGASSIRVRRVPWYDAPTAQRVPTRPEAPAFASAPPPANASGRGGGCTG